MKKKIKQLLLTLLITLLPVAAWSQQTQTTQDGIIYTLEDDHWVVTGYDQTQMGGDIFVPWTICDESGCYPVKQISDGAFNGISGVTSLQIDAELEGISEQTFAGLGTEDSPIRLVNMELWKVAQFGYTAANGIVRMGGGYFTFEFREWSEGFKLTYQLLDSPDNETDTPGKTRLLKVEKEESEEYILRIATEWWANGRRLVLADITDNAMAGIGSDDEPIMLDINTITMKSLGGTFLNGIASLKGGKFYIEKNIDEEGIRVIYAYNEDAEGNAEYTVTKIEKSPYWWGEDFTNYQLIIPTRLDVVWNDDTQQDEYIPVTTIKSGAVTAEAASLIKSVRIDDAELKNVENGALAGLGTIESPLPLDIYVQAAKNAGATFADGVLDLGGGKFSISKVNDNMGIRVTYAYDEDAEGNAEYVITKIEKSDRWDDNFTDYQLIISSTQDGIPVTTIKAGATVTEVGSLIKSVRIDGTNLKTVEDGALAGIGTVDSPLPLNTTIAVAKAAGASFADAVIDLGGGKFSLIKTESRSGILVTYAYNEDVEGTPEYIVSKIEKSQSWMGKDFTDYRLYIRTRQDEKKIGKEVEFVPVTTIKAGAVTEEAKSLIKSVCIDGTELKTVENGALTGLGSTESPLPIDINNALVKTLNGTFNNGVFDLGGGKFIISKVTDDEGIRVTYAYNEDAEGNPEYNVAKIEKSPEVWWGDDFTDYQLYIKTRQDVISNKETGEYSFVPVTTIKAGAVTEEARNLIKSVYIEGTDLKTAEDGALAGLGSTDSPMQLQCYSPVTLSKGLGLTFDDGVATFGGGYFTLEKQDGLVYYQLNGEEYIAASYDQAEVARLTEQNQPVELVIAHSLGEYDNNDEYRSYNVTKIKASAFEGIQGVTALCIEGDALTAIGKNAFKGIGDPQPITLDITVSNFKKLGGTFADGKGTLAGGKFVIARQRQDDRIKVTYAYSEDSEGQGEYIVSKIEEATDWWDETAPYRLTIIEEFDNGQDELTGDWLYVPVTTINADALSQDVAPKIEMVTIHGNRLNTIADGSFTGIGTVSSPAMLEMNSALLASMEPSTEEGAIVLKGGYFRTAKRDWAGNGFQDAIYYSDGEGYMLSAPIKYYEGDEIYELHLRTMFYDWDEANQTEIHTPVTQITKSAFDNIRNMPINSLTIEGDNTEVQIDADAFEGFGAIEPMSLNIDMALFDALGGTFEDGVAKLAGGRFVIMRWTDDEGLRIYYTYQKAEGSSNGEYIVSKVVRNPYYWGEDYYALRIWDGFDDLPVTTIKAGVIDNDIKERITAVSIWGTNMTTIEDNAFAGIGSEAPASLEIEPEVLNTLGATAEDGVVKLAGGRFLTDAVAKVTVVPEALADLIFNGEPQELVTEGEAENGVMTYHVENAGGESNELPTATNAGTYKVYCYAKGINGYINSESYYYEVTIAPKVVEDATGTHIEQHSPTAFTVDIDESSTAAAPVSSEILNEEGSLSAYTLSYKRSLTQSEEPYTVCLPYTPPTEGVTYYTLKGVSKQELVFEEVTSPQAYTPYLAVASSTVSLDKELKNVKLNRECDNTTTTDEGYMLKGTLTGLTNEEAVAEGAYIMQSGNVWKRVATTHSNVHIPPFRAYITAPEEAPARLNGNTTGINAIRTIDNNGTQHLYDLNGRRIAQPTKQGVYIINNKKVIKK